MILAVIPAVIPTLNVVRERPYQRERCRLVGQGSCTLRREGLRDRCIGIHVEPHAQAPRRVTQSRSQSVQTVLQAVDWFLEWRMQREAGLNIKSA